MAEPHASITPGRRRRIERARELRATGLLQREIAEEMGLSRNTVSDLLSDPDQAKKRARRIKYGGICERCGALTDGSAGTGPAPKLCNRCASLKNHEGRKWTPEYIIALLQEFYKRVGRPPTTTDSFIRWGAPSIERNLSAKRLAESLALPSDVVIPSVSVVGREFGSWGKALEAAGIPRSATGGAAHRTRERKGIMPRRYVVFSKNGHGWVPRETVDARDSDEAIQQVADGEGVYVAVAEPHWQERTVAPKTVFAVVADA